MNALFIAKRLIGQRMDVTEKSGKLYIAIQHKGNLITRE